MTCKRFLNCFPLLVPSWIVKQLVRNGYPSSALLNLRKLLQVCSLEDAAIMYCLNTEVLYTQQVFGSGEEISTGLSEYWQRNFPTELARVLELAGLYRGVLEERLFAQPEPSSAEPPSPPVYTRLESEDLQTSAIAIILKPGQFGGDHSREVSQTIVREYMRQSYVFTDYAEIARGPLFERYLNSLALDNVSEPA